MLNLQVLCKLFARYITPMASVACIQGSAYIAVRHIRIHVPVGFTQAHTVRDTLGTALYFFEYDGLRHIMGRLPSGEQGPTPAWMPIHHSLVPFLCGSIAGVSSWALIYPLDV